jgi:4-hydroxybenzoate polyprenyltransferase
MLRALVRLLRPQQYLKNAFVFVGVLFSVQWDRATLLDATLAFLAFCAAASAVYTLNDIMDVEADRTHPVKRHRPIADGSVPIPLGFGVMALMIVLALLLGWMAGPLVPLIVASYFVINVLYSWQLKHVVILDVFSIASGFMLRILAGTIGIGIEPSEWLLLCGLMLTLFLGFAKRRSELCRLPDAQNGARQVLDDYSPALLDSFIAISAGATILGYGLYTVSEQAVSAHGHTNLIYTLPLVIYGTFRYLYLLHHQGQGGDPSRELLTDSHLLATLAVWLLTTILMLSWVTPA